MTHRNFAPVPPSLLLFALLVVPLALVGCGTGENEPIKEQPALPEPIVGDFVFKEVYYTGATGAAGQHYFHDQFVEIYNAANGTLYADGLLIGDVHGVAGEINPGQEATPFGADSENVYLNSVWQVPGTGMDFPIPAGKTLLIAHDATNHQPDSTIDLTGADFETYNEREDMKDTDWPVAPNLIRIHFTGGFDWLLPVFGASVVIFRSDDPNALEKVEIPGAPDFDPIIKVPNSLVIDAFEALRDGQSGAYKRIPAALDKGFVYASDTYTGESARRRVIGEKDGLKILADTNDSSADFEILAQPTPRSF